jgi:hypothetical protein
MIDLLPLSVVVIFIGNVLQVRLDLALIIESRISNHVSRYLYHIWKQYTVSGTVTT